MTSTAQPIHAAANARGRRQLRVPEIKATTTVTTVTTSTTACVT